MGADLYSRAMSLALSASPPDVGIAISFQVVTLPAPPGSNGQPGPVPLWHMLVTLQDPTNITGPHLRDLKMIGNGAPDFGAIASAAREASATLHEMARDKLREAT